MVTYNKKEIYEFQNTTHIIYRIMNLTNNKVYIGQTINTFNIRYGKKPTIACVIISNTRKAENIINSPFSSSQTENVQMPPTHLSSSCG